MKEEEQKIVEKGTVFTSHDLVELFLDFKDKVPNNKDWCENKLKNNLTSFYRYMCLISLLAAFEIKSLKSLGSGNFILEKDMATYNKIFGEILARRKMIEIYKKHPAHLSKAKTYVNTTRNVMVANKFEIPTTKKDKKMLLEYYQMAFSTINWITEILNETLNSKITTDKMNRDIVVYRSMISGLIRKIGENVSPEAKSFTRNELIAKYNYPDIDLANLDAEYGWV